MPDSTMKILCVGKEIDHLKIRCAVLTREGYHARAVSLWEAEDVLRHESFDLVILSALLSDQEKSDILTVVGDRMPTLELEGATFPKELLKKVEQRLAQTRRSA